MPRPHPEPFHEAYRDPTRAVLEGLHPLKHAWRFGAVIEAVCTADKAALIALAATVAPDLCAFLSDTCEELPPAVFRRLAKAETPLDVLAIARRPTLNEDRLTKAPGPIVFLERPTHLGNVGAVIRVAAGAGAASVITSNTADPWHPASLRGAAGLHFALPVLQGKPERFPERTIVAVDPSGEPIPLARPLEPRTTLAFGSERHGLSEKARDRAARTIAIPMQPGVSSLNLATSVAIILYAATFTGWRPAMTPPPHAAACVPAPSED